MLLFSLDPGNRFCSEETFMPDEFSATEPARAKTGGKPRIQFLFWEDCPSHSQALGRLQAVMAELGLEPPIERIEVLTDEDAQRLGFPGSPTIRVDGVDIDPTGAAQMGTALTCRIYRLEDGRISPVPSRGMIRRALSET
jgi:hypothetical protein